MQIYLQTVLHEHTFIQDHSRSKSMGEGLQPLLTCVCLVHVHLVCVCVCVCVCTFQYH